MSDWAVTYGQGWLDNAPPEVLEIAKMHSGQGKAGVLEARFHSHLPEFSPRSCSVYYAQSKEEEIRTVGRVFESLLTFLGYLQSRKSDVCILAFVNLQPETHAFTARPAGFAGNVSSLGEGLRLFSKAVANSVGMGSLWSNGEWALLTCTRQPAEQSVDEQPEENESCS